MTMTPDSDPADHTVAEVTEYLASASDFERDRVLAAERDGKARVTITDWTPPTSEQPDAPLSDGAAAPVSDKDGVGARAYDADGNVRPADGRWLGDANDDKTPEELAEIREQEIERNRELAEKAAAEQREKDEARAAEAADKAAAEPEPATGDGS
jgi:hypothetical protein